MGDHRVSSCLISSCWPADCGCPSQRAWAVATLAACHQFFAKCQNCPLSSESWEPSISLAPQAGGSFLSEHIVAFLGQIAEPCSNREAWKLQGGRSRRAQHTMHVVPLQSPALASRAASAKDCAPRTSRTSHRAARVVAQAASGGNGAAKEKAPSPAINVIPKSR